MLQEGQLHCRVSARVSATECSVPLQDMVPPYPAGIPRGCIAGHPNQKGAKGQRDWEGAVGEGETHHWEQLLSRCPKAWWLAHTSSRQVKLSVMMHVSEPSRIVMQSQHSVHRV